MGWHNNPGSLYGSDTLQVRLVQQLYAQSLAAGVPMAAWWPLGDLGGAYQLNSGLVAGPTPRKPAFTAYQVLVRELGDVRYVEELDKGPDIKVYHYEDVAHGRTIYIAWTNPTDPKSVWGDQKPYVDTTRKTNIAVPGSRATVYDALWNQVTTSTDSADGKTDDRIKITINGDPKYIVVEVTNDGCYLPTAPIANPCTPLDGWAWRHVGCFCPWRWSSAHKLAPISVPGKHCCCPVVQVWYQRWLSPVGDFDTAALRMGWYIDYRATQNPASRR